MSQYGSMSTSGYEHLEARIRQLRAELERLREENKQLREAAREVLHEYDLWAEDANDGEFAIWSRDRFMEAFLKLQLAFNALKEEAK